ncbi:MAG: Ig-like domain-containing protein, partial [Planctomycetota bacterium]|nr:Ig-like domain-containing protein [Planctomycetota bacterium]
MATPSAARFLYPSGVAVDPSGNVYVADTYNHTIRKGTIPIADRAIIDSGTGPVGTVRQLDTTPQTAVSWQWSVIRCPAGSVAALSSTSIRNPTFTPDVPDLYVFRLIAADASGALSVSSVNLIATNTPPTISDIPDQTTDEDTPVGPISFTVGDAETPANPTVTGTSGNTTLVPDTNIVFGGSGTDRTVTITPAANQHGTVTITVTVSDGSATSSDTFVLTVNPVNDPPVASDQNVTTAEDTPKAITLTATDADGDALTYVVVSGPSHGTLSGTAPNLTYTPDADYSGADSFTFKANDGAADSNVATVS